jgi:hypothetical protein
MLLQPLPVPIEPPQDCELIPPGLFPKKQPKVPRQYSQVPTAGPTPANFPLGQAVQPDSKAVPMALVMWPAGQSRQDVEAGAGWYFEIRQEVQTPASRYSPAGQPVQSARRVEPVAFMNWPAGQSRQEVEPGAGWYLEAGQEVQAPAEAYLPAGQAVQSARRAEPVPVVKWPAGQSRQAAEPGSGWYVETGQEVQAPAEAYLPAGQPVQPEAPPQLSPVPQAGQSRQEVEAGAGWYLEAGQEAHPAPATTRLSTAMSPL